MWHLFSPGRQNRPTEHKLSALSSKPKPPESSGNQQGTQSKPPSAAGALVPFSTSVLTVSAETESEEQVPGGWEKASGKGLCVGKSPLSEAQVRLLVGLYYLPHEHGPPAQNLLQALTWLKSHCHYVSVNGSSKKMQPQKVYMFTLFVMWIGVTLCVCARGIHCD